MSCKHFWHQKCIKRSRSAVMYYSWIWPFYLNWFTFVGIVTERIPLSLARNIRSKLPPQIQQVYPYLTVHASQSIIRAESGGGMIFWLQEFPWRRWMLGIPTQCFSGCAFWDLTFGHSHSVRRWRNCGWRLHNLLSKQGWYAGSGRARGSIYLHSQTSLCRRTRTEFNHISVGTLLGNKSSSRD